MLRFTAYCLILLIAAKLDAQNITLSGKVKDQDGKAVSGAIVSLLSKQLTDTTDQSGEYSITALVSDISTKYSKTFNNISSMKNGVISVQLPKASKVAIEFYNLHGKLLYKALDKQLSGGTYQFDISNQKFAQNMMLFRLTIDQHTSYSRFISLKNGYHTIATPEFSINGSRFSKIQATVDTLQASALGYKTQKIQLSSYTGTFDFTLENEYAGKCTQSKSVDMNVSGSGPHEVVVETNSDQGINEGTIYRPKDMAPGKKYPIFVWGNGACSRDGSSNSASMAELASHGYFVISDGTPGGSGSRQMVMSDVLLKYVNWAIEQNRKPCGIYYQSLDTTKIGANGFSCGGMLAMGTAHDPRITTWGITSSGSFSDNRELWDAVHTPVLIIEGHKDETGAYNNGLRDYNGIAPRKHPIMFFSNRNAGHGGDLWSRNGGDFTKINLAWLNWWLKGDEGATGKGALVGSGCKYCSDSNWEVKSANLP